MRFQIVDTYVDSLDHVQEISLQDQRLSGMIEHTCRLLQLLKVF